jgi:sulfate adenylyltransferase subunit 2
MSTIVKNKCFRKRSDIHFREVIAQFDRPVLLFRRERFHYFGSKAFFPSKILFHYMDTGHNFPETIEFRDRLVKELGLELIVRNVQDAIDEGKVVEETGKYSRNSLQTTTLLDAIEEFKFDACIGGARRDEEKHELKSVFFLFVMISVGRKPTSRVI